MVRSTSFLAPDQRIDAALHRLLVEVDAVRRQRFLAALAGLLRLVVAVIAVVRGVGLFLGAADASRLAAARHLGHAVGDVVDRIEPRHVLLLQEIDGVRLALGEHRDQHVGAGHFLAAGRLDMNGGALQHALEAGGGLRLAAAGGHQPGELVVEILRDVAAQPVEIDAAGAQTATAS